MLLVGLTGNIASGKSTVAKLFGQWGATLMNAESVARWAMNGGSPAYPAIGKRWGEGVTAPDGLSDRQELRQRIFTDSDQLEALSAIVHPEVQRLSGQLVDD